MTTALTTDPSEWVPEVGVGDRLRVIRRKQHRSQQEMADLLGVKKVTYASWEAGIATPPHEEVVKLARRLYVTDRVPQWWTLGAEDPTGRLRDAAPVAQRIEHLTTDHCVGVSASPRRRFGRRASDRPRHLAIAV